MKEITDIEKLYVQKILRRMERLHLLGVISIFCLSIVLLILLIVKLRAFGHIPDKAASYMLLAGPFNFSTSTLSDILISETGSAKILPALLSIYWGYSILCFLAFTGILVVYVKKMSETTYHRTFRRIIRLVEAINAYHIKTNWLTRLRFTRCASLFRIYNSVSPLSHCWYKESRYQWFKPSVLPEQERSIVYALSKFEDVVRSVSFSYADCIKLLPALSALQDFMFSVARRSDPFFKKRGHADHSPKGSEIGILISFQQAVRPLMKLVTPHKAQSKRLLFIQWVTTVVTSRLVQYAITLSVLSAIVMFLGVFLFGIGKQQAFLTWFTATFGSLTISVSITSVLSKRKNDKSTKPDEPTSLER
ncbi:MAG: hypothetical protein ABSG99_00835 [Sedimentisphaerales bacterium]